MPFRLVPEPPQIGDTDGFSKSDIFDARNSGERLANIVGDLEGHSAIVLDGPWGSGKSIFVKQWAGLLRQRGHPVVYFDAFEHDHLDDAFFPLFGHLLRAHSSGTPVLQQFRESLFTQATALLKATPKVLVDVGLRTATGGALSASAIREVTENEANQSAEAVIAESIDRSDLMLSCVRDFRETLRDAVAQAGGDGNCTVPLVFVIDELDRCRPSYALKVLERIKHVFAVDNTCFVFVTHLDALASMVKREYGLPEDSGYLDKFFQLRFDIRALLYSNSDARRQKYLTHLAKSVDMKWSQADYRTIIMNNLVRLHDIPLRTQERIMVNRRLYSTVAKGREDGSVHSFGERDLRYTLADCLCVMREADPQLYRVASSGALEYEHAVKFLRFGEWTEASDDAVRMIDRSWKVTTLGGVEHLTDDEKAHISHSGFAGYFDSVVASVCSEMDQVAQ